MLNLCPPSLPPASFLILNPIQSLHHAACQSLLPLLFRCHDARQHQDFTVNQSLHCAARHSMLLLLFRRPDARKLPDLTVRACTVLHIRACSASGVFSLSPACPDSSSGAHQGKRAGTLFRTSVRESLLTLRTNVNYLHLGPFTYGLLLYGLVTCSLHTRMP